ncbi:hypothetical protein [Enterobacter hormaechei]|uniref:hypothetical protein n=1 Tax=Enterobacter hormaechei TaxID=158836 RepID=UPI003EB74788
MSGYVNAIEEKAALEYQRQNEPGADAPTEAEEFRWSEDEVTARIEEGFSSPVPAKSG